MKKTQLSLAILFLSLPVGLLASQIELKDGRVLQGEFSQIDSVGTSQGDLLATAVKNILIVDDQLRRIFLPRTQVVDIVSAGPSEALETFKIPQRNIASARKLYNLSGYHVVEDFDEHGRRIVTIDGKPYIQGITEINPKYVRIRGQDIVWDMRMATTSFPRETISKIVMQQIDPKNIEDRKRLVRFYIQGERDLDAKRELEAILHDFADNPNIAAELSGVNNAVIQSESRTMLRELELRRSAGQFELVKTILKEFPRENVSGEILQRVRNMLRQDEELEQQRTNILSKLRPMVDALTDAKTKELADAVFKEIESELDVNTIDRMVTFLASVDDPDRINEEKLSLAISGWFVGALNASTDLALALSMQKTRDLVVMYLTKKDEVHRDQIFEEIKAQEAGNPETVARILPLLKPPFPMTDQSDPEKPGYYVLETPSYSEELPPFQYCVQLPPEYNPNRRYPMIVTLHGNTTADQQIDWWAGTWRGKMRAGQASRQGYIVIAPSWNPEDITPYDFSAAAQAAILYCYYDAIRHFAVDTDRVYITGHSIGGSAAWDIGLARPDLWAGIISIGGYGGKDTYTRTQVANAKYVPTYFIGGELDSASWLLHNKFYFDWYLQRGYSSTVVQYRGRGHESFSDEILRLFDWMKLCTRTYPVKEFEVSAMRLWDNAFWWVEAEGFSSKNIVDPMDWPPPKAMLPAKIEARVTPNNGLKVTTSQAQQVSVWVSPDLINFDLKTDININGKKIPLSGGFAEPDLRHILDDVRTRHDRKHPYWVRYDSVGRK